MATSRQRRILSPYVGAYPNPIRFAAGDRVNASKTDEEYPGWTWVTTADGNSGWAPQSYLAETAGGTTATTDYSARELTTKVGEIVELLHELNGWCWVRNSVNEEGWIPIATTTE